MTNDQTPYNSDALPPGKHGNVTVMPHAENVNESAEELTWPVVAATHVCRVTVIEGPPNPGNATAEELTWPVVSTGH